MVRFPRVANSHLPKDQADIILDHRSTLPRSRPDLGLLPLPEEEYERGKVDELHAMSNFRVRILPVLGPLPAMVRQLAPKFELHPSESLNLFQ